MALILIIETSTTICSISLSYKNLLLKNINCYNFYFQHINILHLFIIKILKSCNLELLSLDAIAFNNGPGSYTSLKIGLATAKGISYALNIPLISFNLNPSLTKLYNNFLLLIRDKYSQYNILSFGKKIFFNINKYYLFQLIKKNLIKTFFLYTRYDVYLELSNILKLKKINYYFINTKYFINIVYSKYKNHLFFKEKDKLYLKYNYI
ncbi:tRNA (adenosine(37)-N6)-threonylcarbamoyltransferase complex dimerization subunit type 1 TsaB [Candidatus Karelsulcia muelleri]